jgi:hypothetical protein
VVILCGGRPEVIKFNRSKKKNRYLHIKNSVG